MIAALSQVIGLPLTASYRAANMRTLHFGRMRAVEGGAVGDYALHIQCPWRVEGPDGIVTGHADLWDPVEDSAPYDANWDYEKSPNLQDARMTQWLERNELVVSKVEADEFGGAAISFHQGFVLRLFPGGSRGEDWRFFQPNTDNEHLVISGGAIEPDEDEA